MMNDFLFIGYIKIIVGEKISLIPPIMHIIDVHLPKLDFSVKQTFGLRRMEVLVYLLTMKNIIKKD